MNFLKLFVFHWCVLLTLPGFTQLQDTDSIIHLQDIIITAKRQHDFSAGTKTQIIDSLTMNRYHTYSLSTLLENESPLFIKSYGAGGLATSSFRGGSANHTAILWNGFNLNSPMNGQLDLSLIPNGFVNSVSIQHGGTSALWGSGAVGGIIHLNNDALFNKGITASVETSMGSFANYQENMQVEVSKTKWISSLKIFNNTAKNNFPYFNTQIIHSPKLRLSNAELRQHGFLAENYFRMNDRQKINIRFWYQNTDRNIPPIMLQTINKSTQKDESYRLTSEWQRVGEKAIYMARMALFDENLIYSDYAYNYQSVSHSQTMISEIESKIKLSKNHLLDVGLNYTFAQALSDAYPNKPKQNREAVFASYRVISANEKLQSVLSVREERMGNSFIPFTYSLGSDYEIFKWCMAKANVSRVYRIPAFNDLYWVPGGNINLLPESGYCQELGVKHNSINSKINLSFEATVFNRNMDNWILWLPGSAYWSPQNIMKVWSRGMETHAEVGFRAGQLKLKIAVFTNYVVSTNEKSKMENDASIGKQLIYVPMYSGHGKISVEYKDFILSYLQNYTGYRYTSTDNEEYLKPYFISNIYAAYKVTFNKYSMNIFAQANNIFNAQYQVLLNRAMPLINYQVGISMRFNKPNTN